MSDATPDEGREIDAARRTLQIHGLLPDDTIERLTRELEDERREHRGTKQTAQIAASRHSEVLQERERYRERVKKLEEAAQEIIDDPSVFDEWVQRRLIAALASEPSGSEEA